MVEIPKTPKNPILDTLVDAWGREKCRKNHRPANLVTFSGRRMVGWKTIFFPWDCVWFSSFFLFAIDPSNMDTYNRRKKMFLGVQNLFHSTFYEPIFYYANVEWKKRSRRVLKGANPSAHTQKIHENSMVGEVIEGYKKPSQGDHLGRQIPLTLPTTNKLI